MRLKNSLDRFLEAQELVYATALAEVKSGEKRSHWMWYIFPQIAGLGFSETSRYFALRDLREAVEYLNHPVLAHRLIEISQQLLELGTSSAHEIFGSPDDLKLRSSMTLFASISGNDSVFTKVLDKYFSGVPDEKTVRCLKEGTLNL